MKNDEFRKPLIKSAAVIVGAIILFIIVGSSGAGSTGGGIMALFSGIGNTILFAIGMTVSIILSICVLIGIFLASVSMVNGPLASEMYQHLKKKISR